MNKKFFLLPILLLSFEISNAQSQSFPNLDSLVRAVIQLENEVYEGLLGKFLRN